MGVSVHRQLLRGATVTLEHDALDAPATSPAASVVVYGPSGVVIVASASASVDTTSITVTAHTSRSDTITASATNGAAVGRYYTVLGTGGQRVTLTAVSVTSTAIQFDQEIPFTAATIKSRRFYRGSVVVPDVTYLGARVVWSYTGASGPQVETDTVDIVRMPWALSVPEWRVARCEASYTDSSGRAATGQIAQAIEDVAEEVLGRGKRPELCIEREHLEAAAAWRVCELRHIRNETLRNAFRQEFDRALARWERSGSWYDADDDLADGEVGEDGDLDQSERLVPVHTLLVV